MNFSKNVCYRFSAILLFGLTVLAHGSVSNADLQKQYVGELLTLRRFYPGKRLEFEAGGRLVAVDAAGGMVSGSWTAYGQVRVQSISLEGGVVHILGQRLFLFFDPVSKQFRDIRSVTKKDKTRNLFRRDVADWASEEGKTDIKVDSGMAHPEMADLTKAMNTVFLAPGESLAEVAPEYWRSYLSEPALEPQERTNLLVLDEGVLRVKKGEMGVSPPRQTYAPQPHYSDLALQAKYWVAVVLLAVVVDENGLPQHIQILEPVGLGLDEAAVNAVGTWRFDPAKRDGQPTAQLIAVEVDFHLH
jgi:TonB family protein